MYANQYLLGRQRSYLPVTPANAQHPQNVLTPKGIVKTRALIFANFTLSARVMISNSTGGPSLFCGGRAAAISPKVSTVNAPAFQVVCVFGFSIMRLPSLSADIREILKSYTYDQDYTFDILAIELTPFLFRKPRDAGKPIIRLDKTRLFIFHFVRENRCGQGCSCYSGEKSTSGCS